MRGQPGQFRSRARVRSLPAEEGHAVGALGLREQEAAAPPRRPWVRERLERCEVGVRGAEAVGDVDRLGPGERADPVARACLRAGTTSAAASSRSVCSHSESRRRRRRRCASARRAGGAATPSPEQGASTEHPVDGTWPQRRPAAVGHDDRAPADRAASRCPRRAGPAPGRTSGRPPRRRSSRGRSPCRPVPRTGRRPGRRGSAPTSPATHCDAAVLHVAVGPLGHLGRLVHRRERGEPSVCAEVGDEPLDDPVRVAQARGVVGPVDAARPRPCGARR